MQIKCNLYKKIKKGKPLEPYDLELISQIAKRELRFLLKSGIPLTPQNYEKWFKVFCYITERNQEYSRNEILKLYEIINKTEKTLQEKEKEQIIQNIIETLKTEAEILIENVNKYEEKLTKKETQILKKTQKIEEKPIKNLLEQLVSELKDIKKQNETFKEKIEIQIRKITELEDELQRAKSEAKQDPLTKLLNKTSFERILQEYINIYKKNGKIFSLILLDLDNFKKINDTYGHVIGDEVLKHIATLLKQYLRDKDIIARIGGEEFAILLPDVDISLAFKIADRLRAVLENRIIMIDKKPVKTTASFGIIEINENINTPKDMMQMVDIALYRAKKEGKNKVILFQD
ncbi:MAG: diguanylate cyclase [Aquificae bacterium]|nr:diguanylate cyclase [Aquificota bacterium]